MIELNEKQKKAVKFTFGTASVIVIPGSGKTLTMATRIRNLVRSGIPPETILELVFTRNAAGEKRNKLRPVQFNQVFRVTLSTIHSFGHRLLKEEGRTFEMLHGKRQVYLMRKVIRALEIGGVPAGFALREIGLAKSHLMNTEQFQSVHKADFNVKKGAEYQLHLIIYHRPFVTRFQYLSSILALNISVSDFEVRRLTVVD